MDVDYEKLCDDTIRQIQEWNDTLKWSVVRAESHATISKAYVEGRPPVFKTESVIMAPLRKVLEVVREPELHVKFDKGFKQFERLEDLGGNPARLIDITLATTAAALGGFIASRRFVDCRVTARVDVDKYMLVAQSIDHPSNSSLPHGVVLGHNYPSGVIFQTTEDNDTSLVEIVCCDLRGYLPSWAISKAMANTRLDFMTALQAFITDRLYTESGE